MRTVDATPINNKKERNEGRWREVKKKDGASIHVLDDTRLLNGSHDLMDPGTPSHVVTLLGLIARTYNGDAR